MSIKSFAIAAAAAAATMAGSAAIASVSTAQMAPSDVIIGTIRSVDRTGASVTLTNGKKYGINWEVAEGLRPGDKIELNTVNVAGRTVVTEASPVS